MWKRRSNKIEIRLIPVFLNAEPFSKVYCYKRIWLQKCAGWYAPYKHRWNLYFVQSTKGIVEKMVIHQNREQYIWKIYPNKH
jgi:hypothetical protein